MRLNVIKCQQRSRLNEQGNERNEWECFTPKSLINLASHQPLSSVTPSSPYCRPPPGRPPRAIYRVALRARGNYSSLLPQGLILHLCPVSLCLPHSNKHSASLDLLSLLPIFLLLLHLHSLSLPLSSFFFLFFAETPATTHTVNASSLSALPGKLNMHKYPCLNW